jgi:guanine deaminase
MPSSRQRTARPAHGGGQGDDGPHCPEFLRDTAEGGARDGSADPALAQAWPRAVRDHAALRADLDRRSCIWPASWRAYPDTFIQTHVSENEAECAWVRELFPQARSYIDVYDSYGMMRPRAMYGHCIWLNERDRARMAETRAAAAICPTSNLFLGSGLFDFERADRAGVLLSLATTWAAALRSRCCKR